MGQMINTSVVLRQIIYVEFIKIQINYRDLK
jgi:hypothetical protein